MAPCRTGKSEAMGASPDNPSEGDSVARAAPFYAPSPPNDRADGRHYRWCDLRPCTANARSERMTGEHVPTVYVREPDGKEFARTVDVHHLGAQHQCPKGWAKTNRRSGPSQVAKVG
jgi:hypothetical protein